MRTRSSISLPEPSTHRAARFAETLQFAAAAIAAADANTTKDPIVELLYKAEVRVSITRRITQTLTLVAVVAGCLFAAPPPTNAAARAPAVLSELSGALPWRLVGPFRGGWSEMVEGIPAEPDVFFFGAAGGGVWRTGNAGRTWTPLFTSGPAAPVGALAIAPSDPRTIYIGTGQPEPRYDVAGGCGVFKSRDGGKTWSSLGLERTRHIGRILVNPHDSDNVLVAAVGHFFGPSSERGVFRSIDGGKTWSHPLAIGPDTGAVDLAADPADANVVFAAAWQARQYPWQSYFTPISGPGSGLYGSRDGGVTWTQLSGRGWPRGPLGRISLATARTAGGLRIYAVVSAGPASGLYRSDDAGADWQRVNAEPAFTNYYASRITVAPDDPNAVYTVGQSIRRCSNGGTACTIVKGAPGGDDYHGVWINPAHPDHIATVSDQGTAVSVDGGTTWSSWYNQPTGQFYHLATDDRFPYWIYSGQQDSGTVAIASRSNYGAVGYRDWHPVGGDERDDDVPDPADANIVYGSGLGGTVTRFEAKTGQVAAVGPYLSANYGRRQTTTRHHFAWVTPLAISRRGPVTLYLGGEVVFASPDRGKHWSVISPDLTGKRSRATGCDAVAVAVPSAKACGYGSIWTIAPSSRHAGEIWVGTDDGLIQLTRDGGRRWRNVTPPSVPSWAKIANLDVSTTSDGVAYAAIDNQRQDDVAPHVLKTRDYGATWQNATGDLPGDHFVAVVRADPIRAGLLYAGTEIGVFVSFDDGAHWAPLGHDLPTASVRDLLVHGNDLVAATQGRAIWVFDDLGPVRDARAVARAGAPAYLFAPARAFRVRDNNYRDTPLPPDEPAGRNPPRGAIIDYWLARAAHGRVRIEIIDASGTVVSQLTSDPEPKRDAELYFSAVWLRPAQPLSRAPGLHRVSWNLRYTRPRAIAYEYSIAATPGEDTPLTPGGPFALPGRYRVVLDVDGTRRSMPLDVSEDPRVDVPRAALSASLALSRRIDLALERASRGTGQASAVRNGLQATLHRLQAQPAEERRSHERTARRTATSLAALETGRFESRFADASEVLARIETDLEGADLAPTQPQRMQAMNAAGTVDSVWRRWAAFRATELTRLNRALELAGTVPIRVPTDDEVLLRRPAGGADVP